MTDLHRNLALYLQSHGWASLRDAGAAGRLWDHEETDLSVAVPHEVKEGSLDWRSITARLAEVERVTVEQVVADILFMSTDVANLRAANDLVITDTIPYEAGTAMMRDAWRMFRSCATTSMKVRAQIRGNYNKDADEIAGTARMAHTKRGSFIIPLLLPVSEPVPVDTVLVDAAPPEPVERRVMRTFAEALTKVHEVVVTPEREPRQEDALNLIFAGVSAEFATALHHVLSAEAVAEFGAEFQWAPVAGPHPENLNKVSIPAAAAPRVEAVAKVLRNETQDPGIEILTGPIVAVARDPEQGGTVTIDTFRKSRSTHVSVRVTEDQRFDDALDWMKRRTTVALEGRISRHGNVLMSDRHNGVEPLSARQLVTDE
ncbi:hypothetical protein BJF86_08350 [Serinicoccus sp. CNJ-927]|uniref:hypothetical protein n=1 Tax=Serinicoccus sp. CNJ-927 TaxID=1904970 RepID=UPI00095A46D5|nr:hypothetical protein [Serinicoccus sp. CNJ-927]OLT39427.1 hypothetical protein BJF86_08350 [Serinicoccus sp. CNJ-927]